MGGGGGYLADRFTHFLFFCARLARAAMVTPAGSSCTVCFSHQQDEIPPVWDHWAFPAVLMGAGSAEYLALASSSGCPPFREPGRSGSSPRQKDDYVVGTVFGTFLWAD